MAFDPSKFRSDARNADRGLLGYVYTIVSRDAEPAIKPVAMSIIAQEIRSRVKGPKGKLP